MDEAGRAERQLRLGVRVHAALDLLFAALYGWVGLVLAPSRQLLFSLALGLVVALLAAAGLGLLLGVPGARRLALLAQALLLAFAATVVALLVASAAYLRGVYGPLGQAASAIALLVAALVLEGCGLLPLLQLRFLSQPSVRALLERRPGSTASSAALAAAPGDPAPGERQAG
jgi:hypothetical protein